MKQMPQIQKFMTAMPHTIGKDMPIKTALIMMREHRIRHLPVQDGGRIHEFRPSVLHAKTVLIDDWVKVGSSNLNSRSLLHDLEADVVLHKKNSLRSVEQRFEADLRDSSPIDARSWPRRSWLVRKLEKFVLLFRRWL